MFCDHCEQFLSETFSKAKIPDVIHVFQDIGWASHEKVIHHTLRDLKRASDLQCRLCRIICSLPTKYDWAGPLNNDDEALDIVLNIDLSRGPFPVITVEFLEASGRGVKFSKRTVASCSGLLDDEDLGSTLQRSVELKNDHTGSEGALQLASYWVKKCVSDHEKCRPAHASHKAAFMPTRVVDVSNDGVRLIETKPSVLEGDDRRYCALSHCWGPVPIIKTEKANYDEHCKAIPWELLSKTFREAILTTRQLGFRYIWIDSLCIKQDDGADWAAEAATMCDVYQNAILTIAATQAEDGGVGCFKDRDGLLQLPFYLEIPQVSATNPVRVLFQSYGRVGELGGGTAGLFGRAWVLQEQMLPPRLLMFDGTELKWECLTMHGSEGSPISGTTRNYAYHRYVRSGIMGDYEIDYLSWCDLVVDYTHRGMTKMKDRLIAMAGVGQALSRHTKNEYFAGIWSDHFASGLLWSISHYRKFSTFYHDSYREEEHFKIRHKEQRAPSWSWASVTVPIIYSTEELFSLDRMCEVVNVSVAGSLDKQSGRAQIRGHIRHGYVNPVYPFSIREAKAKYSHMTGVDTNGNYRKERINFKDRVFSPNDYFLFSEKPPTTGSADISSERLTTHGSFHLVRGSFRPDQVLDPAQRITFIAMAQKLQGCRLKDRYPTIHPLNIAYQVQTLALIPTGVEGEYQRVGLAIWDECAWYGYMCGFKDSEDRIVDKPGRYEKWTKEGRWDRLGRKLWWDDLEFYEQKKMGTHAHSYEPDSLPRMDVYNKAVQVEEKVVVIV